MVPFFTFRVREIQLFAVVRLHVHELPFTLLWATLYLAPAILLLNFALP